MAVDDPSGASGNAGNANGTGPTGAAGAPQTANDSVDSRLNGVETANRSRLDSPERPAVSGARCRC